MTGSLRDVQPLIRQLVREILELGEPEASTIAELSAAGLCVGLGATGGHKVPRGLTPTPDWQLEWGSGNAVDVEVTIATEKPDLVMRRALANDLLTSVYRSDREFDVIVHMVDVASSEDRAAVANAAADIAVGDIREYLGRWRVRGMPITRDIYTIVEGPKPSAPDDRPAWWPKGHRGMMWQLKGAVAGPGATRAPAQVRVCFDFSRDAYLNPVQRKVEASQGRSGIPFLIAVDVGRLPDAHQALTDVIDGYLEFWPSVSGFLIYQDAASFNWLGWSFRIIRNPHAAVPLPATFPDYTDTTEVRYYLSSSERPSSQNSS
jgi:hypothetical protein